MSSDIVKELPELVENKVISQDTAHAIENYYATRKAQGNSQLIIFGALGSVLVGLGIILIFAHNWDEFSIGTKTLLAFLPLVLCQMLAGYSIVKEKSGLWREVSGGLLFFAVGAAMALIGQVYNITGDDGGFILTWIAVCLPLIYVLRSDTVAVLYIIFSTFYAVEKGYFNPYSPWLYLPLMVALLPYYLKHLKRDPESFSVSVFNWLIPLSLIIALGAFISGAGEFGFVIYIAFLCLLYNIGLLPFFRNLRPGWNGCRNLGRTGIALLLLATSFRWFWKSAIAAPRPQFEFLMIWLVFLLAGLYTAYVAAKGKYRFSWYQSVVIIFPLIYLIGRYDDYIPAVLNNILVLCLGVAAIREGTARFDFSLLNFGLVIISGLIISRFFDTNMSFAIRGLLFIAVGVGFFLTNYFVIKKKRNNPDTTAS